jgi:hypothetical protein
MSELTPPSESRDLVAKAGRYYRNARYIVVAGAVLVGLWFAWDGWVKWPAENARLAALSPEQRAGQHKPHPDFDIQLQRIIAAGLVILAFPMLGWFLYRSRGEYRLAGTTLYVPGHPPVPLEAVVELDKSKWERKGIAFVDYQLEKAGAIRRLALDDFIYDRGPTDQIVERIEAHLPPAPDDRGDEDERDGDVASDPNLNS